MVSHTLLIRGYKIGCELCWSNLYNMVYLPSKLNVNVLMIPSAYVEKRISNW